MNQAQPLANREPQNRLRLPEYFEASSLEKYATLTSLAVGIMSSSRFALGVITGTTWYHVVDQGDNESIWVLRSSTITPIVIEILTRPIVQTSIKEFLFSHEIPYSTPIAIIMTSLLLGVIQSSNKNRTPQQVQRYILTALREGTVFGALYEFQSFPASLGAHFAWHAIELFRGNGIISGIKNRLAN